MFIAVRYAIFNIRGELLAFVQNYLSVTRYFVIKDAGDCVTGIEVLENSELFSFSFVKHYC